MKVFFSTQRLEGWEESTSAMRTRPGIRGREQGPEKLKNCICARVGIASSARTENTGLCQTACAMEGFEEGAENDIYHQFHILGGTLWK